MSAFEFFAAMSQKCFSRSLLAALCFCGSGLHLFGQAPAPEDWTAPSIAKSNLKPQQPILAERDDRDEFIRELVQVEWRAGDPIYLFILLPKLAAKPPVIVYLYNYATETQQFLNDDFCKLLTKDGFAAVGFAPALSGQRYHDRPMREWFVSELQEALGETAHDVQMVLNYLAARDDLDMTRVGLFGDGSGGAVAVLSAAADRRARAIDLLDAWGDWPDWLAKSSVVPDEERTTFLTPAFLSKVAPLDPVRWLPSLTIPMRMQYIRGDGATPARAIDRMQTAAPKQTLLIPRDRALSEYRATSGTKFLDWLKNCLRKAPAAQQSTE